MIKRVRAKISELPEVWNRMLAKSKIINTGLISTHSTDASGFQNLCVLFWMPNRSR